MTREAELLAEYHRLAEKADADSDFPGPKRVQIARDHYWRALELAVELRKLGVSLGTTKRTDPLGRLEAARGRIAERVGGVGWKVEEDIEALELEESE